MPHRSEAERLLDALHRTGALLAAADASLERITQNVTDAFAELTGARWAAFFRREEVDRSGGGDGGIRLAAVAGPDAPLSGLERPEASVLFAPTLLGGRVVRADDVAHDPGFGGLPLDHFPVRSYLAVPVDGHAGAPVGALLAGHPDPDVFRGVSERVAVALADQAAAAIDNARLFRAHRALEEKLLEANERLAESVEERTAERDRLWRQTTDCMAVMDEDTTFRAANPAWERLLGWREREIVGRKAVEFVHPEDVNSVIDTAARVVVAGALPRFEHRYRHKDGSFRTLSWAAVADRGLVHAVGRDVTAEREAADALERVKDQLRQAHRLEAIGLLGRGVAHEFANCAAAVIAGLRLFDKRFGALIEGAPAAGALLAKAGDAAARGGATARRLLAFAKRDTLRAEPIGVADLLARIRDGLVGAAAGAGNAVRLLPFDGPDDAALVADPAQLAQVLVALVMNAREAMPPAGGGTVAFSAHVERVPDGKQPGLFGGDYVRIDVRDDGRGMDERTVSRCLEPFFTTKPAADGTGLGLSSALGFAEQSGGSLRIRSEPGKGTTVSIWLPKEATRA